MPPRGLEVMNVCEDDRLTLMFESYLFRSIVANRFGSKYKVWLEISCRRHVFCRIRVETRLTLA